MSTLAQLAAVGTGSFGYRVTDAFLTDLKNASNSASIGVAFDVGANNGAWTRWLLRRAALRGVDSERLRVHVFEPQPRYESALKKLEQYANGSVRFHRAVASTTSANATLFYPASDTQAASTLPSMAAAYSARGVLHAPLRVPSVDLASFVGAETGESSIALLKCDVEGGEYTLLPRLLITGALCRVRHLLVEWHLNALSPHERLSGLGMRLGFDRMLRAGCAGPESSWHVEHDEFSKNNLGETVDGLSKVCNRKSATRNHTRWESHTFS